MLPAKLHSGGQIILVFWLLQDHIYTDTNVVKVNLRWRTACIIRELEKEIQAYSAGRQHRQDLINLIEQKVYY